jgi:glutamate-1-semialdehyde 2,1-aminomutase
MNFDKSKALQGKSHSLIPGGAHTYAKGDDQYPELAPGFIERGKGCHVWDLDGNEFIEYGMGLRSVTLGHAYEPVVEAAYQAMKAGINFNRPSSIEVECAEKLLSFIDGADMVKFAKNGSDVTTAAVKLARAYTGRDLVAICVDHPFYSVDDWFIGTTDMSAGIPQAVKDLTVKFHYNDIEEVKALFETYPNQIACLFMEVERLEPPKPGFLQEVKELCQAKGALLVFDEIVTGFRWDLGGAQKCHGVTPDLTCFGKAMGNGFSIAALVGKREIMELGGLHHNREKVFLLSTTYGAETHALAASLATMKIYETEPVIEHLYRQGERLMRGVNQSVQEHHLEEYFGLLGRPCALLYFTRDREKQPSQPLRTLFIQEIIRHGIIAPSLMTSYSHTDEDIDRTVYAINEALSVYRKALEDGYENYLVGQPVKPAVRKYN